MAHTHTGTARARDIQIRSGAAVLQGELSIPGGAKGVVLFAHGSGSSRHSPRNQFVARTIREAGVGTLLFDLLTSEEEAIDMRTRHLRFDIGLLAQRLVDAAYWIKGEFDYLNFGYFGASTGAGAALVARVVQRARGQAKWLSRQSHRRVPQHSRRSLSRIGRARF